VNYRKAVSYLAVVLVGLIGLSMLLNAQTIKVGVIMEIRGFDPYYTGGDQIPVTEQIYDKLLNSTVEGTIEPALAASYEILDEDSVALTLRDDVVFHDGTPLVAQHIADLIELIKDPAIGYAMTEFANAVGEVEIIDDHQLIIHLADGTATWAIDRLSYFSVPAPWDQPWEQSGIGTGPFVFEAWEPGIRVTMNKNPDYWRDGFPKSDRLEWYFYDSPRTMIDAMKQEQIDWAITIPFENALEVKSDPNMTVVAAGLPAHDVIVLNGALFEPFKDKLVRQAINYALDRQAFAEVAYFGYGKPINSPVFEFDAYYQPWHDEMYYYDLDKARRLLELAGYADGFEFTLLSKTGNTQHKPVSEILKEDLAKIGVTVNIDIRETTSYKAALWGGETDAVISGMTRIWGPTEAFNVVWGYLSENPYWEGGTPYQPYVDALTRLTNAVSEEEKQAEFHRTVFEWLDGSWAIYFCTRPRLFGANNYIEFTENPWTRAQQIEAMYASKVE